MMGTDSFPRSVRGGSSYLHPFPMEIVQTPGRVVMLFEYDHLFTEPWTGRRVYRAVDWDGGLWA